MSLIYGLSVMLIKVAILLSWIRLFVPNKHRPAFFWISHALIWSNVLLYSTGTIIGLTHCKLVEHFAMTDLGARAFDEHCSKMMSDYTKASGFINLVSDMIVLLLPQRVIWKLHVSWKQKIGMSLLFVVGIL
jgi:hypothetical protein